MAMFLTPAQSAANPPSTWQVVKAAERCWQLQTKDGGSLGSYPTRRQALEAAEPGGYWFDFYERERRWFAGETPPGYRSWADCKAEHERAVQRRIAAERTPEVILDLYRQVECLRRHGDMRQVVRDGLVVLGQELLDEAIAMEDAGVPGATEAVNAWGDYIGETAGV